MLQLVGRATRGDVRYISVDRYKGFSIYIWEYFHAPGKIHTHKLTSRNEKVDLEKAHLVLPGYCRGLIQPRTFAEPCTAAD